MAEPVTTFLLTALTLFTKRAVGNLFEKGSILEGTAQETAVTMVKSVFNQVKDNLLSTISAPENNEILRSAQNSYLNSALFVCFARLKYLSPNQWSNKTLLLLEGNAILPETLKSQLLPDDESSHKEIDWLVCACKSLDQKRGKMPEKKFIEVAGGRIEEFLTSVNENRLFDSLKNNLQNHLVSDLAETGSFVPWASAPQPALPTPTPQQSVMEGGELPVMQSFNTRHKNCLPPKLLDYIENGWTELKSPSETEPLGLNVGEIPYQWFDLMRAYFAQELKQNPKAADFLQNRLLADLKYSTGGKEIDLTNVLTVETFRSELAETNIFITKKLEAIESEISGLSRFQSEVREKLLPMADLIEDIPQMVQSRFDALSDQLRAAETNIRREINTSTTSVISVIEDSRRQTAESSDATIQRIQQLQEGIDERFERLEATVSRPAATPNRDRDRLILENKLKMLKESFKTKSRELVNDLIMGKSAAHDISAMELEENFLNFLVLIHSAIDDLEQALEYHNEAMTLLGSNLPSDRKSEYLCSIAIAHLRKNEFEKAIKYYEEAVQILKQQTIKQADTSLGFRNLRQ